MNAELFEKARELGEMLAASPEYQQMRKAQDAFDADPDARRSVKELDDLRETMQKHEHAITSEALNTLKIAMKVVKQRIDTSSTIEEMQTAKENFSKLMGEVNQVIQFVITGESAATAKAPAQGSAGAHQVH